MGQGVYSLQGKGAPSAQERELQFYIALAREINYNERLLIEFSNFICRIPILIPRSLSIRHAGCLPQSLQVPGASKWRCVSS